MLSRFMLGCLLAFLGIIFLRTTTPAFAQTAESDLAHAHLLSPLVTISKSVDEVNLMFTVTDRRGRFVSNLRPEDFDVRDNKLTPQRLTFFQQRSDLPLHLALLIDASASVKYRFKMEQAAALAFISKILRPGKDQALVIAFNDQVKTIQDLTDKTSHFTSHLSKQISKVSPEGNTALYDAVIYASEKLRKTPEAGITRRSIVIISDGEDTVGRSTLEQAEEAASKCEVLIFSLSTNISQSEPNSQGDAVLSELASSTGGRLLPAQDDERLRFALHDVDKALRNQYVIAYSPLNFRPDGTYRRVEVSPLKSGLRANYRKGYYARAR